MPGVTEKGARTADAIVEATLRALGKHGYAATSLQRVAEEAGTSKRMVHYYFETREQLFEQVVRRIGDRLLAQVEEAVHGHEDSPEALVVGFEKLWQEVTSNPELQAVYFGLVAESVTDEGLRRAMSTVRDHYRELIGRLVSTSHAMGQARHLSHESMTTLVIATTAGLTLEFLERGDTPALRRSVDDFKTRFLGGG